jgi:hypothetical protein
MALLTGLLLPITGPVTAMMWVAQQLLQEARRQYYNEPQILNHMLDLERRFTSGEVDEQEFDETSDVLMQRLLEARAWSQAEDANEES